MRNEQQGDKEVAERCLIDDCGEGEFSRGLCKKHYQAANKEVNNGSTTWRELEGFRMALPKRRPGKKSDFVKALEEKRRAKRKAGAK